MNNFGEEVSFVWFVTDLLRGSCRPNKYKCVMPPITVLHRIDWLLEPTKDTVMESFKSLLFSIVFARHPVVVYV